MDVTVTAVRSIGAAIMSAGLTVVLLAGSERVHGEQKHVAGTGHDVASPSVPACIYCHIQKSPEEQSVWETKPPLTGFLAGLKRLCFSCHDGTVTSKGAYVFESARPEHPRTPGIRGQDCDRCHDPHGPRQEDFGFFLKLPGAAEMCHNCHATAGPANHPVNVDPYLYGVTPADTHWDPYNGDYDGTRLWNAAGTGEGNLMKCLTCHGPHGGHPGTGMLTVGFPAEVGPSLCQSCHFRELPR